MITHLILVLGYQAWLASGLRVLDAQIKQLHKNTAYALANCVTSEVGENLASAIHAPCFAGACKNPFSSCPSAQSLREQWVQQLAAERLQLCEVGKLAKSGNFFSSEEGSVLVKRIDSAERRVLVGWSRLASDGFSEYPGGCKGFAKTLMVQVLKSFIYRKKPYLVMPNLTHYLAQASPNNWVVKGVYDAKPLPNLGEGLVKLFKDLQTGWGENLERLSAWQGWKEIRHQLSLDVEFLAEIVVDYSLFVHVLASEGEDNSIPQELEPRNGCMVNPGRTTIVCLNILDYMTPFTWQRQLESDWKAAKFDDYHGKFLHAVDCTGGDPQYDCANYKALASITEAASVSKAMAKSAFIGVLAFPTAFTCTYQVPSTKFYGIIEQYSGENAMYFKYFDKKRKMTIPDGLKGQKFGIVGKEVIWRPEEEKLEPSRQVAQWLQTIASPERGTSYIRKQCDDSSENITDYECTKSTFAFANFPLMAEEMRTFKKQPLVDIDACVKMVNEFSTEGYMSPGNLSIEMQNVLWAPSEQAIIAVRGKPYAKYVHQDALKRAHEKNCLLKTIYLRCTPDKSEGAYFNYKQHFGTLEVMILSAREYSDDAWDYATIKKNRFKTALNHELMFM